MLNNTIRRHFATFRAQGYRAAQALTNARIQTEFYDERDVDLRFEPDSNNGLEDLSMGRDCFNSYHDHQTHLEAVAKMIEEEGVFCLVSTYTDPDTGEAEEAYAVGGFIGEFNGGDGYEFDAMRAALDALEESRRAQRERLTLPAHAFPGCYRITYISQPDNATLCASCATDERIELRQEEPDERLRPNDPIGFINYEGASLTCDGCNTTLNSAYGE